jgi:hypothetical protein
LKHDPVRREGGTRDVLARARVCPLIAIHRLRGITQIS